MSPRPQKRELDFKPAEVNFPTVWNENTLYIDEAANTIFRWSNTLSDYVDISESAGTAENTTDRLDRAEYWTVWGISVTVNGWDNTKIDTNTLSYYIGWVKYTLPAQVAYTPTWGASNLSLILFVDADETLKQSDVAALTSTSILLASISRANTSTTVINPNTIINNGKRLNESKFNQTRYNAWINGIANYFGGWEITASGTALQLNNAAGAFIDFSGNIDPFIQQSNLPGRRVYEDGSGWITYQDVVTSDAPILVIPNNTYDDGSGVLQTATGSQWLKHILFRRFTTGEYLLAYSQWQFPNEQAAIDAPVPTFPQWIEGDNDIILTASIVLQRNDSSITDDSITDLRRWVVSSTSGGTGTAVSLNIAYGNSIDPIFQLNSLIWKISTVWDSWDTLSTLADWQNNARTVDYLSITKTAINTDVDLTVGWSLGVMVTNPVFPLTVGANLNNTYSSSPEIAARGIMTHGIGSGVAEFFLHRDDVTISTSDELGKINFTGSDSVEQTGATIRAVASQAWSTGSAGTDLILATTPAGSVTPVDRIIVDSSGVGIGVTPSKPLDVQGVANNEIIVARIAANKIFEVGADSSSDGFLRLYNASDVSTVFLRSDAMISYFNGGGSVLIGATALTNIGAKNIWIEGGVIALKETTTPTADADYGKVYTKTDNELYFQDWAWVESQVSNQGWGWGLSEIFHAVLDTWDTMTTSEAAIVFDVETIDTWSNFNTTTWIYTVPSDGIYKFDAVMQWNSANAWDRIQLYVKLNGSTTLALWTAVGHTASNFQSMNWTIIADLTTGDEVHINVRNITGSRGSIKTTNTYFEWYKLA